jgi:hypothetical protein
MKGYLKKGGVAVLIILIYFTAWRGIRGFVTSTAVIPQIEYAVLHCDEYLQYDVVKPTSLRIWQYNREAQEYNIYSYTTPAGFYLLAGVLVILLLNGTKIYYLLLAGYHGGFWLVSTLTILPGFCIHPLFLHITYLGIKYLTPFVTFMILIMLISPGMKKTFNTKIL